MATVTKRGAKPVAPVRTLITLPSKRNEPSQELSDYSMLFYGPKKIGKTSFASHFPDALFGSLEPGTKALRVYAVAIENYKTWVAFIDAIIADKSGRFKSVVVDTIDLAYLYTFQHVCKEQGIQHPNEEKDYGATWGRIRKNFREQIVRLLNCGRGVVFLSHETEKEMEDRDGEKYDRIQPTLSKQGLEEVEGIVDIVGYYHYIGTKRAMRIDGLETVVAGNRLEEKFIRKGGAPRTAGDRISRISMGQTSKEAHENFIKAFKNEQSVVDPFAAPPKPPTTAKKTFFVKRK